MGDEEDEASMGAVRYPVMPSLVSLQTMRNRLHLAQLGKKLMKWTALATGKELRRLSIEMTADMKGYAEKVRNAFILLARARYFFPDMNVTVLEGVSKEACVTVMSTARSVSGVKVKNIDLVEMGCDSYSYLGMGKGGMVIKAAKEAWLELLKMMVLQCQYRTTFKLLHAAYKNATKKQNVLARCVIPRITITMRYILSELDEQEREESFRLKRFKQLKYKNVDPVKKKKYQDEDEKEPKEPAPKSEPKPEPKVEPEPEPKVEPEPEPKVEPKPEPQPIDEPEPLKLDPLELLMNHIIEVVRLAEKLETEPIPEKAFGLTICDLAKLKFQLKKLIEISEPGAPIKDRVCSICGNIGKAVSSCACPKQLEAPKPEQTCVRCGDFKTHKPDGYETAMKLMPRSKVKTTIPEYILKPRPKVDPMGASEPLDFEAMSKNCIEELENHVDQVICMTNHYQCEGLLSKSAEDFLKCYKSVKVKIQEFECQKKVKAKLDLLKDIVTNLEKITTIVQKEDLSATPVSSFMSCCKEFKAKLDSLKLCRGAPSVRSIEKLLKRIDCSIVLSKEAKDKGLVSESVEDFIKSCVEIKTKIEPHNEPKPQVIDDLLFNINDIIGFITKYKDGELVSDSIETFYHNCQITKAKLVNYKAGPPAGCEKNICPKTPPKTPSPESSCPCIKGSQAPLGNSCSAGTSVPSEQGTTTTCGGQSAVSQESQNSCKSNSTQDSAPPCIEHTCVHKQPSTHSCNSQSYKIAPPEKSKSVESGRNLVAVSGSQRSVKVILITKNKMKDPKACKEAVSTTTIVRTYKQIDGSIVKETETFTVKQRVYDGQKPPSKTSSCRSCASTGRELVYEMQKPPSKNSLCRSCASIGRELVYDGPKPPSQTSSCRSCASTGRELVYETQKPLSKTSSCISCASTGRERVYDGPKPPSKTSSCVSCASTGRERVYDGPKPPSKTSSCGSYSSGKSVKRVINLCKIPVTKGFLQTVRNIKSETLIRSVDLLSSCPPFLCSCVSADTLISLERSHENEIVEPDPFFCASPTTSDDDSILPM